MAETRREIITALKLHRAAMKQANEQQQQLSQPSRLSSRPIFEQDQSMAKSRGKPRICPSSASNFTLPNQTLGLNLNFHDFDNLDTKLYHKSNNLSIYSSSVKIEEVPSVAVSDDLRPTAMGDLTKSYGGGGLEQAMDDEGMAEMRSLGEQHQMEWNDSMNLVTSAWWFKFLKTMELGPELKAEDDIDGDFQPFDQTMEMEFPAWLKANDSCLQQHFNDHCPDDYFQVHALPCMDIEEIEGMDGEWLA